MPHEPNETLRKSLHIALGFGAFLLRWIPWPVAIAICGAAVLGNWLLLHHIVGKRVARHERGYDVGIILYPLVVGLLILVFRNHLAIAGAVWGLLAFGDGFATVAGRAIRGPRLPWNGAKSWSGFLAFLFFGLAGASAIWRFLGETSIVPVAIAAIVAAIVESLALGVDDNLVVPAAGAVALWLAWWPSDSFVIQRDTAAMVWLAINLALSIAGYLLRSVDVSGMVGGFLLGAIIILCGGWPIYVALLAFFLLGTATTKLGYRRKAAEGLAQEKGGRRSFGHAFANAGVAAILSVAIARMALGWELLFLAAVASLATAAADTCASEIGQLFGRRTFLPLTFRPVPRGTEGAISVEGTLAGIVAAAIVAVAAILAAHRFIAPSIGDYSEYGNLRLGAAGVIVGAAFLGSYLESILGSWNRRQQSPIPNGVLNFFNTLAGACIAGGWAVWAYFHAPWRLVHAA